jgi:hypothetical protein
MTWWLRFCLGLPARRQDVEELRQSLPELFDVQFHLDEHLLFPWWPSPVIRELKVEDLRRWAQAENVPSEPAVVSPEDCPAEECPLRKGPRSKQARPELAISLFMVAGGVHKPPKDEFLNLVRKVHRDQEVRQVIITDPYIYLDLRQGGQLGDLTALIDYLRELKLNRESDFDLKLNPSPKDASPDKRKLLKRKVKAFFPKVRLGTFPATHKFHDRFYLTRDRKGTLAGIFGPSLNGLGAKSIVLMGELEKAALERLENLV